MQSLIVPFHVLLVLLWGLHIVVRIVIASIGRYRGRSLIKTRRVMHKLDVGMASCICLLGFYPMVALSYFEMYHLLKLVLMLLVFIVLLKSGRLNFLSESVALALLFMMTFILGIKQAPIFTDRERPSAPQTIVRGSIDGKAIFTKYCTQCHGADGKKGLFEAADLTATLLSAAQKKDAITNGIALTVMRSFKHDLTDQEIDAVVAYIEGFKASDPNR